MHLKIFVSSIASLERDIATNNPTHVLSIMDPGINIKYIPRINNSIKHIKYFFFDEDELHLQKEPVEEYLNKIIDLIEDINRKQGNEASTLMIHCHAGASRSPAIAYIAYAIMLGLGNEKVAFEYLLKITNKPWPNLYLVKLADKLLSRNGKLVAPLENYRKENIKREEAYRRLNKKRDIVYL